MTLALSRPPVLLESVFSPLQRGSVNGPFRLSRYPLVIADPLVARIRRVARLVSRDMKIAKASWFFSFTLVRGGGSDAERVSWKKD